MDRFKFRVWKQDNWGYNIKNEFVKQKPANDNRLSIDNKFSQTVRSLLGKEK